MTRPSDDDYYVDSRTEHVAQGDIFREIPFYYGDLDSEAEVTLDAVLVSYGILISYTSGMMQQPPGSREYAHPWRVVAPVVPLVVLADMGALNEEQVDRIRSEDPWGRYLYLPPFPDEFVESAAVLYRPALVTQQVLEGKRVTQLQAPAAVQLQHKIATTFLGGNWHPEDLKPDLSDHWNP